MEVVTGGYVWVVRKDNPTIREKYVWLAVKDMVREYETDKVW